MLVDAKNDLLYLLNILESIGKIQKYSKTATDAESFYKLNDQLNLNASLNLLANIGENVAKLSPKLKSEHAEVEWQKIKDFRNVLVHDYAGLDLVIAYNIIKNDLPRLKTTLEKIISLKFKENIFEVKELDLSKKSKFYRHVDFAKLS
jgi:uncharacterized protein with HEPN domain